MRPASISEMETATFPPLMHIQSIHDLELFGSMEASTARSSSSAGMGSATGRPSILNRPSRRGGAAHAFRPTSTPIRPRSGFRVAVVQERGSSLSAPLSLPGPHQHAEPTATRTATSASAHTATVSRPSLLSLRRLGQHRTSTATLPGQPADPLRSFRP